MEIDDRDLLWINDFIKNKMKQKNKAFKLYKNNRMGGNFSNFITRFIRTNNKKERRL